MRRMSVAVAVAGMVLLAGCSRDAAAPSGGGDGRAPAVPVSVATAEARDVPVEVRTIGNVEPLARVALRPRVAGQVSEVRFVEGQDVKAGDVLVVLDRRPYEAALREAEAKVARSRVLAADAERGAAQMAEAAQGRAVSQREKERWEADAAAARAQVAEDEAAVERARLNLEFCEVRAPMDGRTGLAMVKPGAVVKENETALVELNQITPIGVTFAVPERVLPAVKRGQAGAMGGGGSGGLGVEVSIPGDEGGAVRGVLTFIDNRVDVATGTIKLRGEFANADRRLWPGQFCNVVLTIAVEQGVVVMPTAAVQTGQKGAYVFVVTGETVEQRPVAVRRAVGGISVIESGVKAGEVVVTDGQLRLTPGARVEVKKSAEGTKGARGGTMDNGQWTVDSRRGEKWKVENGKWKEDTRIGASFPLSTFRFPFSPDVHCPLSIVHCLSAGSLA